MIHWKNICGSRCAIDCMYEWMDGWLHTSRLLDMLIRLGYVHDAHEMRKYLIKHREADLIRNMKRGLKRHA